MFRLVLLCFTLFTTGCVTNSLVPQPITEADLSETNGVLVGSFSRDPSGPKYYSQTFRFKNVSTGKEHSVSSQPSFNMFSGKTSDDFKLSNSHGGVFALSLPAGEYTFHNFRLYQSNGYFEQNWTSQEPYSIPFSIQANKVNYVGEIKLSPLTAKNVFGIKVQAGGVWIISDQKNRDFGVIATKHPEIPLNQVVSVIPERKEIFTPLVILPSEVKEDNKQASKEI